MKFSAKSYDENSAEAGCSFFSGGAAGRHCPGCRFRCARRSRVRIVRLIASCRDLPPFSRGEQAFGAEKELCEGGGRRLANER